MLGVQKLHTGQLFPAHRLVRTINIELPIVQIEEVIN